MVQGQILEREVFPIFVGTVLAEHLVGKLCNSLRAHGRKIQKSHYSSKMRGMYGVGTSSDVTFSLMLFNSFAKVCPARGHQRSRPSHSPHHAKLTHNTATPIKRITTAYDTRIYKNHRLQAASAIQPVDCPRRGERLLSPPFQHFHAEGLTTTYTLRRRARISGQSLVLRTDSARRTNTSFNHASVDKTTPVLQARPTLDVAWVESITTGVTPQIITPLTGELQRIQNRRVVLGTNTDHTDLLRRAARRSSTTCGHRNRVTIVGRGMPV